MMNAKNYLDIKGIPDDVVYDNDEKMHYLSALLQDYAAEQLHHHSTIKQKDEFQCFKVNSPGLKHRLCNNWCGDEVCAKGRQERT